MEMLGGEFRWLKMSREEDQMKVLVEERKLDDIYHASRTRWRREAHQQVQQEPVEDVDEVMLAAEYTDEDAMALVEEYLDEMVEKMKAMDINGGGQTKRYRRGNTKTRGAGGMVCG